MPRAMGHLLVLYTWIDQFIMEVCAARIATAPDNEARRGLAKQVGLRQSCWKKADSSSLSGGSSLPVVS